MSEATRTYEDVIGEWIVGHAENVQDMGDRVTRVLGGSPRDHHYAASKLGFALSECARALTLAGWSADDLAATVREMHEEESGDRRDLKREFDETAAGEGVGR